uniref:Uncharacterized protein n=1 Tax=Babesia bovis TaxID=5865 RepID=S6B051_BABBO|nr:conserved hypothetical protein [Babesia bovis]
MGFKRGVMYRISAEIDNALPEFAKSSRDCEYDEVFELIDASWVSGDWVVLLSYGERLSHYALSERRLLEDSNFDNLSKFCQRLWLLGTYDVFKADKSMLESLYSPEIVDDLNHIVTSQNRITLLTKIRAINTLTTVLQTLRQNVLTVWEVNSLESHQYLCERFRFISIDVLLQVFNNYLEAPQKGTSYQRRKAFIGSMVRLAAAMRHIWLFRDDLGGRLVEAN